MFCTGAPGGVVAGVFGIERALLRPVSMVIGLVPVCPFIPCPCQLKLSWFPMLGITPEALVGGVGKVCARSRGGRPMLLEGNEGTAIELWCCWMEGNPGGGCGLRIWLPCSAFRRSAVAAMTCDVRLWFVGW